MTSAPTSIGTVPMSDTVARGHIFAGLMLYEKLRSNVDLLATDPNKLQGLAQIQLSVASVTNMALGLELLLKTHHFQHSGEYPHTHDVGVLGGGLADSALKVLRAKYLELLDDPKFAQAIRIDITHKGTGQTTIPADPATYDLAIVEVGKSYEFWRYVHEEFDRGFERIGVNFKTLWLLATVVAFAIDNFKGNVRIHAS